MSDVGDGNHLSQVVTDDVLPLRERGKHQGAMFGVATAAGPLLGGLFSAAQPSSP